MVTKKTSPILFPAELHVKWMCWLLLTRPLGPRGLSRYYANEDSVDLPYDDTAADYGTVLSCTNRKRRGWGGGGVAGVLYTFKGLDLGSDLALRIEQN